MLKSQEVTVEYLLITTISGKYKKVDVGYILPEHTLKITERIFIYSITTLKNLLFLAGNKISSV